MKSRLLFATLATLLLTSFSIGALASDGRNVEELKQLLEVMRFGGELPPEHSLASAECPLCNKCGTLAVLDGVLLSQQNRQALDLTAVLSRPESDSMRTFDSPAGHFKVHYTTDPNSIHKIDDRYGDQNSNGIPDYPEIVARIADSIWNHHINQLGYNEPLNDALYWWGGDSRYDIYVRRVGAGAYGITWPDTSSTIGNGKQVTSWMELDTHYERFPGYQQRPIEALQVTLAHEFFHAIQFAYDATEAFDRGGLLSPYWLEMSAVWMEEESYDNVNDYYAYLPYYIPYVHKNPRTWRNSGDLWQQLFIYGEGILPIYLAERFGSDIIKKIWEDNAKSVYGDFLERSIHVALNQVTGGTVDFAHAWAEYGRWLYFTGSRWRDQAMAFEEGAAYPLIPDTVRFNTVLRSYVRTFSDYPIDSRNTGDFSFFPDDLGVNYLDFRTGSLDTAFNLSFNAVYNPDDPRIFDWRFNVMAFDRFNANVPVWVSDSLYRNFNLISLKDFKQYTDIVVLPFTINTDRNRNVLNYRFAVSDSAITVPDDIVKVYPTKFDLSKNSDLTVSLTLTANRKVAVNVLTVAGEKVFEISERVVEALSEQRFLWNGRNDDNEPVASGVYIVQVRYGDKDQLFKVLVVR